MENQIVKHNISLTFDFVRELINNPALAEQLPDEEFELEFIEKDVAEKVFKGLENKQLVKVHHTFELIPMEAR
jgi:hypothetical protein